MKIAYCIEGMYNTGGMERMVSIKANYLSGHGYDVTIITAHQKDNPYAFPLNKSIECVDLNVDFSLKHNLFHNGIIIDYHKKLAKYLYDNKVDICISTGGMELEFFSKIKDGSKKIAEFHFTYNINEQWMLKGHTLLLWSIIGKIKTLRMVSNARRCDKVVVLTKADLKKWKKHCSNVMQIYNPITINTCQVSDCTSKQIVAVGRLDYQKGFDYLIDSWITVHYNYPDWQLNIYGEGPERENLQKQINTLGLQNVVFLKGATDNIVDKYYESSALVLSSRFEGFPLVIIEGAACGLPIVSFDCPSGPSELVETGRNGFLISKVGDIKTMEEKICMLINDEKLREQMGAESKKMSEAFNLDNIMKQWTDLFDEIVSKEMDDTIK